MALVIISGYPCAGKTTRAHEIKQMLETRFTQAGSPSAALPQKQVLIVNDELLGVQRSAYDESKAEKIARASLLSHTIRKLGKENIVLCDGMNYIKGFRYQLYCAAREAGVRICTVHVANLQANCLANNEALAQDVQYKDETITNLFSRYEEPNAAVRWDSPLIVLPWCDSLVSSNHGGASSPRGLAGQLEGLRVLGADGEEPKPSSLKQTNDSIDLKQSIMSGAPDHTDFLSHRTNNPSPIGENGWSRIAEDLWTAVTKGDLKPVHAAVKMATPTSTNFLHLLETTTTSLITSLLSSLKESPTSFGRISFPCLLPNSSQPSIFSIDIPMGKTVNIGVLQRLKRQYTTMHKQANAAGRGTSTNDEYETAASFVRYVQGAL